MGEKFKPVSEKKQYQYDDKKLEDLVPRVRDEVKDIQKISLETNVRGLYNKIDREKYATEFSKKSIAFLEELEEKGVLPYRILDEYKEEIYEKFKDSVRLHVAAFFKANGDDLSGTLFDLDNPTEKNIKDRGIYISELMSIALEDSVLLGGRDKQGFKLAKYREPEWIKKWMNGELIEELLKDDGLNEEDIDIFLKNYVKSLRMEIITNNIKNPEDAILEIANNYKNKLSDENIGDILSDVLNPEEMHEFLKYYSKSLRMRTSTKNIKNPEDAILEIANNYKNKLSDENISNILSDVLNSEEIIEFLKNYSKSYRMQAAISSKGDPEKSVFKISDNYRKISDENIKELLKDEYESNDIDEFLKHLFGSHRMKVSISNTKNMEKAIKAVADNYINKLSDKNLNKIVNKNIDQDKIIEVVNILKKYLESYKMRIAINSIKNSEDFIQDVVKNYLKLSDDNLKKELKEEGFGEEDIDKFLESYTESYRVRTSVGNVKKPIEAVLKIADNYINELSDDNLKKELKEEGFGEEDINKFLESYTKSYRMQTSVSNIRNPKNISLIFADNYINELSDDNLKKRIKEKGYSDEDISKFLGNFADSYRLKASIDNAADPIKVVFEKIEKYLS